MSVAGATQRAPLLEKAVGASRGQTLGNIIVSVVGTRVLGLPYAMRIAGWLAGSLGIIVTGLSTYYCMLLLVQCREKYVAEEDCIVKKSYGDLGYECMGRKGCIMTESLILTAQCGASVAYFVFVGQNVSSMFSGPGISVNSCIFLLVPVEIGLSWIGSLSALAPFSIFAAICNMLAMAFVIKEEIFQAIDGEFSLRDRTAITSDIGGLPFAAGVAVFCFEGFGTTLALEASMKDKKQFPRLLAQTFTGISIVYTLFGFCGYMAYGDQTGERITLNLPQSFSSIAVQIGLCLGVVFTFPIMLHPINEIIEGNITKDSSTGMGKLGIYMIRAIVVMVLGVFASYVPGFAVFASLVGSTVCALISFVMPTSFHLKLFGSSLQFWQKALNFFILLCGLLFAVYGTYNAFVGI